MDELFQSNPSSDMTNEEIKSYLESGLQRDINILRAMIQIQLNDLSNAYNNLGMLIGVIDPEKQEEFNTNTLFSLQEVAHVVNTALGDEREVSLDPPEKT